MPGLAIWQFTSASVLSMYIGFMAILVGIIELPLLCSCMSEFVRDWKHTRRRVRVVQSIRDLVCATLLAGFHACYFSWLVSTAEWCIVAQRYTRFIAGRWVTRAIIYIGISAGEQVWPAHSALRPWPAVLRQPPTYDRHNSGCGIVASSGRCPLQGWLRNCCSGRMSLS